LKKKREDALNLPSEGGVYSDNVRGKGSGVKLDRKSAFAKKGIEHMPPRERKWGRNIGKKGRRRFFICFLNGRDGFLHPRGSRGNIVARELVEAKRKGFQRGEKKKEDY